MANSITATNLQKSYGDIRAVDGVSFYVEEGSLFAFLGPNGAGKSTTIDMLCTSLKPDGGEAVINGYTLGREDDKIRASIGIVFQNSLLDNLLTVKENLEMRGSFYPMGKAAFRQSMEEAIASSGIGEFLNRPYGKLSGGQRRRADIARALLPRPRILFLDEPTTGLDPQTRKTVWDLIRSLQKKHNMTVFLTTHYMEEAAAADYVTVIDHGRIAAKGTPAALKEQFARDTLRLSPVREGAEKLRALLDARQIAYRQLGEQLHVALATTMDALPLLDDCRGLLSSFEVVQGTMDDAFIGITGEEMRV